MRYRRTLSMTLVLCSEPLMESGSLVLRTMLLFILDSLEHTVLRLTHTLQILKRRDTHTHIFSPMYCPLFKLHISISSLIIIIIDTRERG